MGTTKGEIDFAKRRALNLFDEWIEVTGWIPKFTSTYYELQSIVEDAVECGAQVAAGIHEELNSEKQIKLSDCSHDYEEITDGFGNYWGKTCEDCGGEIEVVRPGKVQCSNCPRNNAE